MKRLAVHIAAEEVVAAYRDLREHPSLEADQRLEGCIALLSLRLDVYERRERAAAERRERELAKQRRHAVSDSQVYELPALPVTEEEEEEEEAM